MSIAKMFKSALLDVKAIGKFVTVHGSTVANPETGTAAVAVNVQATSLSTQILSDALATIRSADAAEKSKGLNLVLDAQFIASAEALIGDIEKLLPGSTKAPQSAQ